MLRLLRITVAESSD